MAAPNLKQTSKVSAEQAKRQTMLQRIEERRKDIERPQRAIQKKSLAKEIQPKAVERLPESVNTSMDRMNATGKDTVNLASDHAAEENKEITMDQIFSEPTKFSTEQQTKD